MNLVTSHLESLKNFKSKDDNGLNKFYLLTVREKPNLIKLGDTHRSVLLRNQETCTNSSLHRTNPVTFWLAQKEDGTWYRDYDVHAFLTSKGYKREDNDQGNQSEWFYITEEQFLEEFEQFIGKPVHKTVELRTAQHYLLEQLQDAHEQGNQYINAGFCVRVGKTIISLTHAANNDWMPVYIGKNLTSQSSAEIDNAEFGIVPEMLTQSLHGVDELEAGELSKKTKQIIDRIDNANTQRKKIIFFVDEVDDASHTKRSREIITPLIEHYKASAEFASIVTMSGTRIYRGEKILKEVADGPIKELSLEYYEMQILQPETTCNRNFRHISYYSDSIDGLTNISDAMKNKDTGHKSLATVVEQLLGTNNFNVITNDNFPHWFMKFATVGKGNANAFVRYLNRNYSTIENQDYVFSAINGDVTKAKEAQEYCKEIIKDNLGKTCVFISQGMATTSFSVSAIGNSVVFTDNELTADDGQALHRSATWTDGKDDCNMIVVTTNDSMEHSFDDIFEDETKIATNRDEKTQIYKELLNNDSMVHYTIDGKSVRPVQVTQENADNVIDQKQKAMTKIAGVMTVLTELDEELLDNIYDTVAGRKSSSKKSQSNKGEAFDPFGNNKKKKRTISNAMSPSEKERILRAFAENAVNIPAVAKEQDTTIEDFDYWKELEVDKDLFFEVYNSSWMFKDRIDSIYNLCNDEEYLIKNYIDKLVI